MQKFYIDLVFNKNLFSISKFSKLYDRLLKEKAPYLIPFESQWFVIYKE